MKAKRIALLGVLTAFSWLTVLTFLIALGGVIESYCRSLARTPIPVVLPENVAATITAFDQPDILWMGHAWRVSVECATPLWLDFDNDWTASLPAGKHQIYSNHDMCNTSDYGAPPGTTPVPAKIMVRASIRQ